MVLRWQARRPTSDVWKNAARLALQRAMRGRNHGLDRLPFPPGDGSGRALGAAELYVPARSRVGVGRCGRAPPPAVATAPASGQMAFDTASLAALRELALSNAAVPGKPDPVVLGHSTRI